MATFEDVWRRARLEMPAVPALLVRSWAQDGYNRLCDTNAWAFLRSEGLLQTLAARSITATFTLNSAGVTSTGQFVPSDAGRQIRVGTSPIYTIATYGTANAVTLDLPYATVGSVGLQTATILDAYATMPADFRRFLTITDRYNQRPIPFWFTEAQILQADPARTNSDTGPRYLVARKYSAATTTLGQVQYEYAPYPTSARVFPYLYIRRADDLTDSSVLPGVLSQRADLLRTYVLSRGAMWPGTVDQKNPFFSPATAQLLRAEWDSEIQRLTLVDDDEYHQQSWTDYWATYGSMTGSSTYLRSTDATVNDYA